MDKDSAVATDGEPDNGYWKHEFNTINHRGIIPPKEVNAPFCLACKLKGYQGKCYRCGHSFSHKPEHTVYYERGRGVVILCEECWGSLAPEERLPWYQSLWISWVTPPYGISRERSAYYRGAPTFGEVFDSVSRNVEQWIAIENAVLNGEPEGVRHYG